MGTHLELLAKDMVPTLHPRCKSSATCHPTGILQLALIRKEQVAQPHGCSKLPLILQETSEWFGTKIVAMREQLDVNNTIEFLLAQVIGVWKRDIHQIKNLVPNNLPAKTGEIAILMTTTNIVEETITSPAPSYQLEQRWRTGMQTSIKLKHL